MCEYCEGKKPLTDKVYDDGSKFDDSQGMSIGYMGKMPILKAYIKPKYFFLFRKILNDEQIKIMCGEWAVEIVYCPRCGKKLETE